MISTLNMTTTVVSASKQSIHTTRAMSSCNSSSSSMFNVLNYYSEPSSVVILFLSFYFPQFLSWSMSVPHFLLHPRKYAKLYILGELFQFFQLTSSMTTFIPWPFMSDIANVIVIDIWKLLGSINILHISLWKCNLLMLYCLIGGFIQTHYSSKS